MGKPLKSSSMSFLKAYKIFYTWYLSVILAFYIFLKFSTLFNKIS